VIDIKLPVSALGLNLRALNCLKYAEIKTIEDLILHKKTLLYLPNLGNGTHNHIKEKLAKHNLYLQTDPEDILDDKKTANELADFVIISNPNNRKHQAIAAMLRQQAKEIEELQLFKEKMKTRKAMVKWLVEESE